MGGLRGFSLLVAMAAIAIWCRAGEEATVVRAPLSEGEDDSNHAYFMELLKLACDKATAEFGPCSITQSELKMPFSARGTRFLKEGREIDVLWMPTTVEREKELLPVRIPLLKGMPGCRLFLIRREDEERFARITSLEELRHLVAGQAQGWPDAEILKANDIKVVEGRNYEDLFAMLRMGRFDYFPRSVCCIWSESRDHAGDGLVVEQRLMIYYPSAIYYFVSPQATGLAARLEHGLRQSIADGSFDRVFDRHQGKAVSQSKLEERRVFRLENPLLPGGTPLDDPRLWLRGIAMPPALARE